MRIVPALFATILLLSLSACFLVKDLGVYWDKGYIDPKLQGTWVDITSGDWITLLQRGPVYMYADLTEKSQLKTLDMLGHTFFMITNGKQNALLRYTLSAKGDRMIVYGPNDTKRESMELLAKNVENIEITDEGVGIYTLDEEVYNMIGGMAATPTFWVEKAILAKKAPLKDGEVDEAPNPFDPTTIPELEYVPPPVLPAG